MEEQVRRKKSQTKSTVSHPGIFEIVISSHNAQNQTEDKCKCQKLKTNKGQRGIIAVRKGSASADQKFLGPSRRGRRGEKGARASPYLLPFVSLLPPHFTLCLLPWPLHLPTPTSLSQSGVYHSSSIRALTLMQTSHSFVQPLWRGKF